MTQAFEEDYMEDLARFLEGERSAGGVDHVYPPPRDVFRAFRLTPFDAVRVVVLGEEPYYLPGHANGLAFSVRAGLRPHPHSLRNITHAVQTDMRTPPPRSGDLKRWAKEDGVLLLNRALTVRDGTPGSHRHGGWWARFTLRAIKLLNDRVEPSMPIVFLLWGAEAQKASRFVTKPHHVICSPHPAERRGNFLKCHPFADTNRFFARQRPKLEPISWRY